MSHATGEAYLKRSGLPHLSCAGCGNGIIAGALMRAFEELNIPPEKIVVVPGIGCSGTINRYLNTNYLHSTHGRALAFATGIKAANPDLHVVAFVGDGDGATIGGNHLIHAARRNMGITVILVNNYNYGMTGGQASGTTPAEARTSTTLMGNPERGFDLCSLITAAGGNYVTRETAVAGPRLQKRIKEALQNPGFSLLEVMSPCTTLFGPRNGMKNPQIMLRWLKEKALTEAKYNAMEDPEAQGYFKVGVFADKSNPSFSQRYETMRQRILDAAGGK
ncbi:thiamine pyrophosphate-dependent enzyme [Desulfovibrio sp. 86]|uniref:2-oxoglutarate synthase subunit KorB n=1 Tax=uncultured Desulfovibrio sp. TaxID=167968 RepID=A0A212LA05_9BACT|nr:thiamine pyrophosphate-dependent enzyme [Desulfovibrio sp. 86]SCM74401.1 2-oxoglutarate synthase subunit KorB [uncultured Desulfovibrio sp.]VZH34812.1 2-oxoglutarate synthase subunit KorB [Desulfovibrio sp. 86]